MGKCIVCNKSAGPFYSLHKVCLPVYRDTQQRLKTKISEYLSSEAHVSTEEILSCKSSEAFSEFHFKQICIKAWCEYAKLVVKKASPDVASAKKLIHLANELNITKAETESYLWSRLENLEYLDALQKNQQIEIQTKFESDLIELDDGECIIWQFEETDKSEQQQYSQQKEWTILNSLLDNLFMKSRYKALDVKVETSGQLIVTNYGLYYLNDNAITETKFSELHSITPMKKGVRIQATLRHATPDTYITGDGRFTYALLQYAQGYND